MDELKDIVARARSGDMKAYGEIVRRFRDMAHGYAYSFLGDFHMAEDVAQEAFIEVYRQLPDLRNPEAFPSWFRRILFKHCDRITRNKRPEIISQESGITPERTTTNVIQLTEEREMKDEVLDAVRSLPEHDRIVTMLFYINGYSQKEIGEFLEVPVTTVKKRLYDSRQKLKRRMMDMVKTTLQDNALSEDFGRTLLRFPFPRHEPEVRIIDCPGERFEVQCTDAQQFFIPLVDGGKCDWTFYDRPDRRLTGVYECHVISSAGWGNGTLLRVWVCFTDFTENGRQEWEEQHFLVEDNTFRRVNLDRDKQDRIQMGTFSWPNEEVWEPAPMYLKPGLTWDGLTAEVSGVSEVTINGHSWKCLKVTLTGKLLYAEWYVADTGRTVFFRRYNAQDWKEAGKPGSFESLEGQLEVESSGISYRHWYDCIPDIVLEK
ncbi:MAG: RNA polymerase sigma factor [Dehalococcoidales bacterium]|nr:RNA polymerase sigma factor [Dehalococcoidales bacterium]